MFMNFLLDTSFSYELRFLQLFNSTIYSLLFLGFLIFRNKAVIQIQNGTLQQSVLYNVHKKYKLWHFSLKEEVEQKLFRYEGMRNIVLHSFIRIRDLPRTFCFRFSCRVPYTEILWEKVLGSAKKHKITPPIELELCLRFRNLMKWCIVIKIFSKMGKTNSVIHVSTKFVQNLKTINRNATNALGVNLNIENSFVLFYTPI